MKIKYGLKLKNQNNLLGYYTNNNNDGDCCVDESYELHNSSENEWLVDSYETALFVQYHSTPWYNADYDTPMNKYKADELEIVKVVILTNPIKQNIQHCTIKDEYLQKPIPDIDNMFKINISNKDDILIVDVQEDYVYIISDLLHLINDCNLRRKYDKKYFNIN